MTKNTQNQITWSQIFKSIAVKSGHDYQTKIKPTVRSGRNKVGSLLETLGRKIQK